MPIIVSCPSCQGKLRVADELQTQMVRCPTCSATFFPAGGETPPPPPAAEWQDLPLEPVPDRDEPVEPEVLDRDDSPPARRPRLPDDDEDLRPCPRCGRFLHRDSSYCPHCNAASPVREGRSLVRQPRRRDTEPDRGALVLTLGILSLVALTICPPVGIILGLVSWVMGQSDLRKMRDNVMDDNGRSMTHAGWICGILGTLLNLLLSLACLGLWVAIMASTPMATTKSYRPPATMRRPVQPPGKMAPNFNK